VQTHASNTLPTEQQQVYGAIKGLTDSYGDPYNTFFPPVEATIFNENVQGSFSGVGMELGEKNNVLTVVARLRVVQPRRRG